MAENRRLIYFNSQAIIVSVIVCVIVCLFAAGCGSADSEGQLRPEDALQASVLTEAAGDLSEEALSGAAAAVSVCLNSYSTLSVPTDLQQFGSLWFLVDCYHNQVIYSDSLETPLYEWKVMADGLTYPHTISSDGTVYLITDTDTSRVLIYQEADGVFVHTQTFEDIGVRPHYSVYREEDDTFYVWSSESGEMYLFRRDDEDSRMYLTEIRTVESLVNNYIRAFTIEGDSIYFVSGLTTDGTAETPSILRCRLDDFTVEAEYTVPDEIAGMACLRLIEGSWYITVSTDLSGSQDAATILRTDDLNSLKDGEWEDLYERYFAGGGTPYAITNVGDDWYLTEHRLYDHALWRFRVEDGEIAGVEAIY